MTSWHAPGSLWNIGHRETAPLFDGRQCSVQEKVDGSFFAFGVFGGELRVRSKGQEIGGLDNPSGMFKLGIETAKRLQPSLVDGWTYRGEFLGKPKQNSLAYDRVPAGNFILFDVAYAEEHYMIYPDLVLEAKRLGLEVVPEFYVGPVADGAWLKKFLDNISILGGQPVEGVVVKPVAPLYGMDKKRLVGKLVSERFREIHCENWKVANPGSGDILTVLEGKYKSSARWQKAVQHLRESGQLTEHMKDIPALMKEVTADVLKECTDDIKDDLFKWAWKKDLSRAVTRGLPEWWKRELGLATGSESHDVSTAAESPVIDSSQAFA